MFQIAFPEGHRLYVRKGLQDNPSPEYDSPVDNELDRHLEWINEEGEEGQKGGKRRGRKDSGRGEDWDDEDMENNWDRGRRSRWRPLTP